MHVCGSLDRAIRDIRSYRSPGKLTLTHRFGFPIQRQPRFLIKYLNRLGKYRVRLIAAISHGGKSGASMLAKRAHHVKDDACLSRLIEMNVVTRDDVEQIVGRERAIKRRVLMIAGHETFLLAKRCREDPFVSVIGAVG